MNTDLASKFDGLEESRKALMAAIAPLPYVQLNWPPAQGKWSIAQIIAHLILVERLSLERLDQRLAEPSQWREVPLRSHLLFAVLYTLVRLLAPLKLKIKAPAYLAVVPEAAAIDTLDAEWLNLRAQLRLRLEQLPDANLGKAFFDHPLVANLSLSEGLTILQGHLQVHRRQIEAILQRLHAGQGPQ